MAISMTEVGVCTAAPDGSTVLLSGPGIRWLFPTLLLQHPSWRQQAALRAQSVMSTLCKVTQGIESISDGLLIKNVAQSPSHNHSELSCCSNSCNENDELNSILINQGIAQILL